MKSETVLASSSGTMSFPMPTSLWEIMRLMGKILEKKYALPTQLGP